MGWLFSSTESQPSTAISQQTYQPTKRNERQKCWEARDLYFRCLDRHDILDSLENPVMAAQRCSQESQVFERDCARSWVKYFKQKRIADYNKAQQLKKLEAEGAIPISQANESKWKFW